MDEQLYLIPNIDKAVFSIIKHDIPKIAASRVFACQRDMRARCERWAENEEEEEVESSGKAKGKGKVNGKTMVKKKPKRMPKQFSLPCSRCSLFPPDSSLIFADLSPNSPPETCACCSSSSPPSLLGSSQTKLGSSVV